MSSTVVVQAAKRLVLPVAVLIGVMIALGLLVTKVLNDTWPLTVEDEVNRQLEADRTHGWNLVSLIFSTLASTQAIIIVTAIVVVALRLILRRWREPLFLVAAVTAQALVFLLTTMAIDRRRPAVDHMDTSPPTSSFPSGHTSAAVALYCGIALLLALQARRTSLKVTWWALLLVVPFGVAMTRMYRGMHHPSDVIGSFINSGTCLFITARAILDRGVDWGRAHRPGGGANKPGGGANKPGGGARKTAPKQAGRSKVLNRR